MFGTVRRARQGGQGEAQQRGLERSRGREGGGRPVRAVGCEKGEPGGGEGGEEASEGREVPAPDTAALQSPGVQGGAGPRHPGLTALPPSAPLQAAAQEAGALLTAGQPRQALGYCSLAVLAGGGRACDLRLRAACLAELQECGRALRDLDLVLRDGTGDGDLPMQVEDLCSRGRLLLSLGNQAGAAGAFAQALRLAPGPAQSSLRERPGRAPAAQVLLGHGQRCLEEQRHEEAWTAAESGLLLDPEHCGLRRLRARLRREAASGCRLH